MVGINEVKKICSFNVNNLHLITMLIPYLNEKIALNEKVYTFFEEDMQENMEKFLTKLILKEEQKTKLKNINWKGNKSCKYSKINEKIKKELDITFIVAGKREYIKKINDIIQKYITKSETKNQKITIVNCYEVMQFNDNIREILDAHDKILNTSGEKQIEDVFNGYVKTESLKRNIV